MCATKFLMSSEYRNGLFHVGPRIPPIDCKAYGPGLHISLGAPISDIFICYLDETLYLHSDNMRSLRICHISAWYGHEHRTSLLIQLASDPVLLTSLVIRNELVREECTDIVLRQMS